MRWRTGLRICALLHTGDLILLLFPPQRHWLSLRQPRIQYSNGKVCSQVASGLQLSRDFPRELLILYRDTILGKYHASSSISPNAPDSDLVFRWDSDIKTHTTQHLHQPHCIQSTALIISNFLPFYYLF